MSPAIAGAFAFLFAGPVLAVTISTTELSKFLMVGMGNNASTDDAININSSNELGANQEFLSTSDPNTRDVFYQNGDRWMSATAVPAGALPMFVGIDYSGNLAVTSSTGKFSLSNIDLYADLGVKCSNTNLSDCDQSVSNSTWYTSTPSSEPMTGDPVAGVTTYASAALLQELTDWSTYFNSLSAEYTITSSIIGQNDKDGSLLDSSYVDGNNGGLLDGFIVVDINVDGDFKIDNSDWIIDAADGWVIFRILNGSNALFGNSSILLGDSGIDGILFLHTSDGTSSSDSVFSLSNVILNGVALWDLNRIGDGGSTSSYNNTNIVVNNAQGCAQFVSQEITMNDVRFTRCAFDYTPPPPPPPPPVPEPGTLALLGLGLLGLGMSRRKAA